MGDPAGGMHLVSPESSSKKILMLMTVINRSQLLSHLCVFGVDFCLLILMPMAFLGRRWAHFSSSRKSTHPDLVIRLYQTAPFHISFAFFPILFLEQVTESQSLSTLRNQAEAFCATLRNCLSGPDAVFKHRLSALLNGGLFSPNVQSSAGAAALMGRCTGAL